MTEGSLEMIVGEEIRKNAANMNNVDIEESCDQSARILVRELVGPLKRNDCTPGGLEKFALETRAAGVGLDVMTFVT